MARRERLRCNRATPRIPAGPGDAIDLRRAVEALETAVVGGVAGAGECHGSGEGQRAEEVGAFVGGVLRCAGTGEGGGCCYGGSARLRDGV